MTNRNCEIHNSNVRLPSTASLRSGSRSVMIRSGNDPNWAAIGEEPLLAAVIVDFAPQWAEWAGKDNFDESFLAELM